MTNSYFQCSYFQRKLNSIQTYKTAKSTSYSYQSK